MPSRACAQNVIPIKNIVLPELVVKGLERYSWLKLNVVVTHKDIVNVRPFNEKISIYSESQCRPCKQFPGIFNL